MPVLPAFCKNQACGEIFPSGFSVDNVTNASFDGCESGPCPRCGSMGRIPDGVFNFIGGTVEVLSAPAASIADYTRLQQILRDARARKESAAAVADRIRNEAPQFSGLGDLLPRSTSELYAFLALIVAIITLVVQLKQGQQKAPTITINQVLNQVFVTPPSGVSPTLPEAKVLCHCGSGKRLNDCCGPHK